MKAIITGLAFCLLAVSSVSQAAIYRCTNESGEVIFTQKPCGPDQQGNEVKLDLKKENKEISPEVCKDVRYLAELMFPHIAAEESILKVYDDLGGRGNLSAGITSVVNYVYNFRYNPKAKQAEVLRLTHEKCLEKGFGVLSKKDMPNWEKIKYSIEKQEDKILSDDSQAEPERKGPETCESYDLKIKHLQERLAQPLNKSDMLRLQADKEYLEHLKQDQCAKK